MGSLAAMRRGAIGAGLSLITIATFSSIARAQVTVRGVLYDDARGTPVRGTVMLVDPSTDAAVVHVTTDSLGQFAMRADRGTYQLGAVRAGYQSVLSAPVSLANGERLTLRVPIAEQGDPTHRIGVVEHVRPSADDDKIAAMRRDDQMGGFAARKAVGTGLHYDRAELDKSMFHTLGEFLQSVPGFRVLDPGSTNSMMMSRNLGMSMVSPLSGSAMTCKLGWFIDGHRMDMPGQQDAVTDGLGGMSLDTIEGIEVFRGLSEMPSEFAAPDLRCGAIAIWTRHG